MKKLKKFTMMHAINIVLLVAIALTLGGMLVVNLIQGEWAEAFMNVCWIAIAIITVFRCSYITTQEEIIEIQDEIIKETCQVNRGTLSKIDIDKFVVTLDDEYRQRHGLDRRYISTTLDAVLMRMGFKIENGKIVEIKEVKNENDNIINARNISNS